MEPINHDSQDLLALLVSVHRPIDLSLPELPAT
jgi:hypothetical protein